MTPSRLLLIEFDALCPDLLDRFMAEGLLPNVRRLYESSQVFTTDAGAAPAELDPCSLWPTVHTGLSPAEHGVRFLGEGQNLQAKGIAQVLSDAGIPVGVCGSLNTNYRQLHGYRLPNHRDAKDAAHPDWLQPFHDVVSGQLAQDSPLSRGELLRFGRFLVRQGLTPGTAWAFGKQLLREWRDPGWRWRRACLVERLQYDLFRSLNRRCAVRFASFFCDSAASFQRYYWRNWEPERFTTPPAAGEHASLADAIPTGYRHLDGILGRCLRDYPDAALVLCSALSQQPAGSPAGACLPRRDSMLAFARVAVNTSRISAEQAEQLDIEYLSEQDACDAERRLQELAVGDEPLLDVERTGPRIRAGCRIRDPGGQDRPVIRRSDGARQLFRELFHLARPLCVRAHPEGILWFRTGRHQVQREKSPLTAVAPTILAHFALTPPAAMREPPLPIQRQGRPGG